MPDSTGSQPITEYRIVQQMRTVTGFVSDGVTVDGTDRFELTAIIRTGTTTETVDQIRRWTAESLEFYDDEVSNYEFRGEEFFYHLQVKQDGKFRTIKSLKPAMEPYLGDDRGDTEDDEVEDEDPLAGDVEPTGGYYEPEVDPFEAQRLSVMRQHGDYTG